MKSIKRIILMAVAIMSMATTATAQETKTTAMAQETKANATAKPVYDESINTMTQIDDALKDAKTMGKYVICQVGGNWCPWCIKFAHFITEDSEIKAFIEKNFVYIHVNYPSRKGNREAVAETMKRLDNPQRFGFPVFVVLDAEGKVIHIQDSSFLEEGSSYSKDKVMRFLKAWTPKAVNSAN